MKNNLMRTSVVAAGILIPTVILGFSAFRPAPSTPPPYPQPVVVIQTTAPTATSLPMTPVAGTPIATMIPPPTATTFAAASPTQGIRYVAPQLLAPMNGAILPAENAVLGWRSDHALTSDEVFDVLVWQEGSSPPASIGTTKENSIRINGASFRNPGKYLWTVRIKGADSVYLSYGNEPSSFTLLASPSRNAPTATPVYVAPRPLDPPEGRILTARNAILRWTSAHQLDAGEVFDVLVSTQANDLQKSLGTTTDLSFRIDNLYAWERGTYYWTIRIKRADGVYLSDGDYPFYFKLMGPVPTPSPTIQRP